MTELSENEAAKMLEEIEIRIENIRNDLDPYENADAITDLVEDHHLSDREDFRPLLKSFCDLLKEKGYPDTSAFISKQWKI
ncbi:MAG TPA: hypothetical protein VK435_12130 [Thermodesulfovibrionales bacterium]|nr:hypothetical protein [Thermodesulfovibrionales bacterium]